MSTTDMLSTGPATTVSTKLGTSINVHTLTQDSLWPTVLDSKSSQEWPTSEPSSPMNTSVEVNTDLESETTSQRRTTNGSFSTEDQELSDPSQEETSLFPTKLDKDSESEEPLLPDHTRTKFTKELPSMVDQERTLETMLKSASMFGEVSTDTEDIQPSGTATTASTRPGTLAPRFQSQCQDHQSQHHNQSQCHNHNPPLSQFQSHQENQRNQRSQLIQTSEVTQSSQPQSQ